MRVPKLEKLMGIEVYATCSAGIGGVIRQKIEDFIVKEVLVDNSKASVSLENSVNDHVLGSSNIRDRYLLCVLIKRNWDTFGAVKAVADQLGITPDQIQFAGIKDAKAFTAQHVTIENASVDQIQRVSVKDVDIRPMGYIHRRLSSFYCLGNSFQITIKNINHSQQATERLIHQTIHELEEFGGVPNFFGHQRFGTTRSITHLVGKAMIEGDYQKAAMIFLAEAGVYEHPSSRQAREELLSSQDFEQALKNFPKQLRYERSMLNRLIETRNFADAFRSLPIKLRRLFLQAYQSYLFNRFLSGRISRGLSLKKAEIGDYAVSVERSGLPLPKLFKIANSENLSEINAAIQKGRMRIAVPLIGFKQTYSNGVQGEIEKQITKEEGVQPENFKTTAIPEIASRGELRQAIATMKNLSIRTLDRERFATNNRIKIGFMLHRGSYATVILRELMKPRNPIKAGY